MQCLDVATVWQQKPRIWCARSLEGGRHPVSRTLREAARALKEPVQREVWPQSLCSWAAALWRFSFFAFSPEVSCD